MKIKEILDKQFLCGYDEEIYRNIRLGFDKVAKPLDGMGVFEDVIARIGAIQGTEHPSLSKSAVIVFAADNGIVEEGVSQSGQEVTAICAENMCKGLTSVCVMAASAKVETVIVDVGIKTPVTHPKLIVENVRRGTRNFLKEPAMTEEEVWQAMEVGRKMAYQYKEAGYDALLVGEIGIGNTTTSSALAAVLLNEEATKVTGYGAGLSDEGLRKKVAVIKQAIAKYELCKKDPITILRTVGGLDIAGMVGLYIGAAAYKIPVVLDGVISQVAALLAKRLRPEVVAYLIGSHKSKEPAAAKIAEELQIKPVIDANMALGEGTGAVLMMALLKTALCVYSECCPFSEVGIAQYERWQEKA